MFTCCQCAVHIFSSNTYQVYETGTILLPFYRWQKEKTGNLLKITQLVYSEAGIWRWTFKLEKYHNNRHQNMPWTLRMHTFSKSWGDFIFLISGCWLAHAKGLLKPLKIHLQTICCRSLNKIITLCFASLVLVTKSCLTLCDSMNRSPYRLLCPWDFPGKNNEVGCHLLLRRSSQLRDQTCVSCIEGGFLTTWEAPHPLPESKQLVNTDHTSQETALLKFF